MFTNFQRKSMMTRAARESFSRRPEDIERINEWEQSYQHPEHWQHHASGYQEHGDYYCHQNQGNRYREQFPQYPSQYENYTFRDHRQRSYQDNKENKNYRDNLDYYMDNRSRGQAWESDNQRRSNSPYSSRYDRRREDSFRSSPQSKYSNRPRGYSTSKSSRRYRSRSPRSPSSRSPERCRKRSPKKEKRSRSKSSSSRSMSIAPETSDGSVIRDTSSKKRKVQQRDGSEEKGHSSEKGKVSVVKEVQNGFKSTPRGRFDRSRYTWKKQETKVKLRIGDLAMSPISSDGFSQRSEEAECEAVREETDDRKPQSKEQSDDCKPLGYDELVGKNSEKITQNEKVDTTENKPKMEYKEERNASSDEMIRKTPEIKEASEVDASKITVKQGLRRKSIEQLAKERNLNCKDGCIHDRREHSYMKNSTEELKEFDHSNSVPNMMEKTEREISDFLKDIKNSDVTSSEKQPNLNRNNKISAGKTRPSTLDNEEENNTETEPDKIGICEQKQKGSVKELKETLLKTSIGSEMVHKIVSLVAKKTKNENEAELRVNDIQDKGRIEKKTVEETTDNNKGETLITRTDDKHGQKSKNGIWKQNKKCAEKVQVSEGRKRDESLTDDNIGIDNLSGKKQKKNVLAESKHELENDENGKILKGNVTETKSKERSEIHRGNCYENINKDLVKESKIIPDESLKEQKLTQTLVSSKKGKAMSVDTGIKQQFKQGILKEYEVVSRLLKRNQSLIKSGSEEEDKTNQRPDGQSVMQSDVGKMFDRPVSPELKESPPPYTSQSSVQNKNYYFSSGPSVIPPKEQQNVDLVNTGQGDNKTDNVCGFSRSQRQYSDKMETFAFSPTEKQKTKFHKLSLTEKKKYQYSEVHMKPQENGKHRKKINGDNDEEVDKGRFPPDKRSNLSQMPVRDRRLSGVTENETGTNARKRHSSDSSSSPIIKKGTMNRPSDEVFIPLGKPCEKKCKLSPTTQVTEKNHVLVGSKTEDKPTPPKEKETNTFAGIDAVEEIDLKGSEKNTFTDKKTAMEQKKGLFNKNNRRISHFSNTEKNVQKSKSVQILNTKEPNSSESKPRTHLKNFPPNRCSNPSHVKKEMNLAKETNASKYVSKASSRDSSNSNTKLLEAQDAVSPLTNIFEKMKEITVKRTEEERKHDNISESVANNINEERNLFDNSNEKREKPDEIINKGNSAVHSKEVEASKLEKAKHQLQKGVSGNELKHHNTEQGGNIRKKKVEEGRISKLSMSNKHEPKPKGSNYDQKICKKFGKLQNSDKYSPDVSESKKEANAQINCGKASIDDNKWLSSVNNNQNHLEKSVNKFKNYKDQSDSADLKNEKDPTRVFSENTGINLVDVGCNSQDIEVREVDNHAQNEGKTNNDKKCVDKNSIIETGPQNDVTENKMQYVKKMNVRKHMSKEKFNTNTEQIKLVHSNSGRSEITEKKSGDEDDKQNDREIENRTGITDKVTKIQMQNDSENEKTENEIDIQNAAKYHKTDLEIENENTSKNDESDDKQNDRKAQSHNEVPDKITENKIQMQNDSDNERTEKKIDIQNAAKYHKMNLQTENENTLKNKKNEKGKEMQNTLKDKKTNEEKELQTDSKNDANDGEIKMQNISKHVKTIKELFNDSEYAKTDFQLSEKPANDIKFTETELHTNVQSQTVIDDATDCDSEMDDIEPIEMIGSVFMNDINMNEPYEDILNYNVDAESSDTDFKVDYCDDSVLFKIKNHENVSEIKGAEKVVEHDTEDKDVLNKKRTDGNLVRQGISECVIEDVVNENKSKVEDVINTAIEKECNKLNKKKSESSKIKISTSKSPNKPSKNTPRKRFAPQLETLGKQIDEKEIENEDLAYNEEVKTQVPILQHVSITEPECSDDDDDAELITCGVELTQTKPVENCVTKTAEWLKKAKSNLKIPSNLTKSKTCGESEDARNEKPGLSQPTHIEVKPSTSQGTPVHCHSSNQTSHSSNQTSSKHENATTVVKSLNGASTFEVISTTSCTVPSTHAVHQMATHVTKCGYSKSASLSQSDNHRMSRSQGAGHVASLESVNGKTPFQTRFKNGNEKTQYQFGYQSSCMYQQASTSVSTAVISSQENNVKDRVNSSVVNTNMASVESYNIPCRYPTSAQQFQPMNTCEMSNTQTAQNNSVQQFQMQIPHAQKNQQQQKTRDLKHGNENQLNTYPVSQQNSVYLFIPETVKNPKHQQSQPLINQGMRQAEQFQPQIAKGPDRQTVHGQSGMNAVQVNSSQQSTAYQQPLTCDFQGGKQNDTSEQGHYSVCTSKVPNTSTTNSKGNDTFSSQNVANVPMFNPLTAPLMNQNMHSAISKSQSDTRYESKRHVNRSDYTGIPIAATQSQGIPVVIPEYGQSSDQSASTSYAMPQTVNYTAALAQIEMPGVREPVQPKRNTQSNEQALRQETSPSAAVTSRRISDSARQVMSETLVEEQRRKLYRELCALENINTGDVALDTLLLTQKSYMRAMAMMDKDILRLSEERREAFIQQRQQQTPQTSPQPGRERQSIEERANYLGQLKRN